MTNPINNTSMIDRFKHMLEHLKDPGTTTHAPKNHIPKPINEPVWSKAYQEKIKEINEKSENK